MRNGFLFIVGATLLINSAQAIPVPPSAMQNLLPEETDTTSPSRVRVRISHEDKVVSVRGYDLVVNEKSIPGTTARLQIGCANGNVFVYYDDIQWMWPEKITVRTPSGFLFLGDRPFREEFKITATSKGCEIVNTVDVEKYIEGLVNSEFSTQWNRESVAAQVIAARTYAFFQMKEARRNPKSRFDVESTVKDQVYEGSHREDSVGARIVAETRGQMLIVGNAPIKAFYHSTCGGHTAEPDSVMGRGTSRYSKAVVCPYCKPSPAFNWALELSERQLRDAIGVGIAQDGVPLGWPGREIKWMVKSGQIDSAKNMGRDRSGRTEDLLIEYKYQGDVRQVRLSSVMLRRWIGPAIFKSTAYRVAAHTNGFRFVGVGNGHGVGMCQWGAKEMGAQGGTRYAILKHYYPQADVRRRW